MSGLKKLAGETAIYGLSSIVGRFLNYLLVPLYTAVFLPHEYGIITELYSYAAFLNVLFTFGMETTYFRFSSKVEANPEHVFLSIEALLAISAVFISAILILLSNPIAALLKYPSQGNLIIMLVSIIGFDTLLAVPFARLRQEGKAKKFALIKFFNILSNIGLNLLFLVVLPNMGISNTVSVEVVLLANLFANFGQIFFFGEYIKLKWREAVLRWHTIKQYLSYGYPIMVIGLAGMVNEVLSRILLKYLLPEGFYPGKTQLAALGIFGACYKLSIFMSLGIQAFRYASEPFFFSKSQDKNSPALYAKVTHWFTLVCFAVLIFISFNLDWIQYMLRSPEYREGIRIVPILLTANLCLGIYYNLSIWYKLSDKTHYGMWISMGGAVLTIILNFILIPRFGYEGSSWATLGCYGGMALASYIIGQKHYPIPYHFTFIAACVLIGAVITFLFWNMQIVTSSVLNSILKNLLSFLLLGAFILFGKKVRIL